jgi:soluble lytic murein transglycosylase
LAAAIPVLGSAIDGAGTARRRIGFRPVRRAAAVAILLLFAASPHAYVHGQAAQLPEALLAWRQDAKAATAQAHAEAAHAALKKGVDHYNGKRYAEAHAALAGVRDAEKLPLGDYILLYRAKSDLALKNHQDSSASFRSLEKNFPDSSRLRDAVVVQCQALLGMNDPEAVTALLQKYKKFDGVESTYYQARALHLSGNRDQAVALYLQVYAKHPLSSLAPLARDYLVALRPDALTGARNYASRLERAESFVKQKKFSEANTLLTALANHSAPDGKTAQKRNLLRAEAEFGLNHSSVVLTLLAKFKSDDADMNARALYLEGASHRRLKQLASFVAARDKALKLYPSSPDTEELCNSVASYYDVNYEPQKAREAWKVLVQAFPKGAYAERARWKVAFFDWLDKDYAASARGFRDYVAAHPTPGYASGGMYWLGRSYAQLGRVEEARYLYRRAQALGGDSYYAARARDAEDALKNTGAAAVGQGVPGIDFQALRTLCDGIRFPNVSLRGPDAAGAKILRRAAQLADVGLEDLAIAELRWGGERFSQDRRAFYYGISRISADRGKYYDSIVAMRTVISDYNVRALDDLPEEVWALLYPTTYSEIVERHARRNGQETALILGLIRQESAFNAAARSRANAQGLMQLLPATALETAASAKITRTRAKNLYDPEVNITLGVVHFSSLMRRYGKAELVLAGYNAGGSRVVRWLKEFGGDDMAEYVEQIPFTETRNYVKQVLSNANHYRTLLDAAGNP